jgi:hypothetical protein
MVINRAENKAWRTKKGDVMKARTNTQLDRMWKRRGMKPVKRIQKTNGILRTWLYAKLDRELDKMRLGLKDLKLDTIRMHRNRQTVPDCPKYRWV